MARRKSRHPGLDHIVTFKPIGGVDLSKSPSLLEPGYLASCQNFIYEPQSTRLVSRHGIRRLTDTPFPDAINGQKGVQLATTAHWAVACNDGKLYDMADDGSYAEIGNLTGTDIRPSMIQFNQRLLVADKSASGIRYWDGSTYGHLSDSPTRPSVLLEVGNRVLSNTEDFPDLAHISGPEDDEDWNPAASGSSAAIVPIGYGDGLQINAMAAYGREVVISKLGTHAKTLRRFSMTGAPDTWRNSDKPFGTTVAAQSQACLISTTNGVFIMDRDGFKSIVPSDVEGGLLVDESDGSRINKYLIDNFTAQALEIVYIPAFGAIALVLADSPSLWMFHLYNRAWTEVLFPGDIGYATSIAATTTGARIGTSTGHIYDWVPNLAADDLGDVSVQIEASLDFPEILPEREGLLKHAATTIIPITQCDGFLLMKSGSNEVSLMQYATRGRRLSMWDLQGVPIMDWTEKYQDTVSGSVRLDFYGRYRSRSLQPAIRLSSGRSGVDSVTLKIAAVG